MPNGAKRIRRVDTFHFCFEWVPIGSLIELYLTINDERYYFGTKCLQSSGRMIAKDLRFILRSNLQVVISFHGRKLSQRNVR